MWHPSQPNGWKPRLSIVDDRVFVLYGSGSVWVAELTLNLALVREELLAVGGAFPMGWIAPGVATWQIEDGRDQMARLVASYADDWAPRLTADDRGAVAGNEGVADVGHWATYLAKPHFRTVIDGRQVAWPSGGALSMAWPWVAHAAANDNLFIRRYRDGSFIQADLPTAIPMNFLAVGRQGHVAYGDGWDVRAYGPNGVDLGSQIVTPWRRETPIRIVDIDGVPNLVTVSWDGVDTMVLIRPFGATAARVVPITATTGDVLQVGERLIVAGSDARGTLTVTAIPVTQPMEVPPLRIGPLPAGYVGWFHDDGRHGTHRPPRNCIVIGKGMYGDGATPPNYPSNWATRLVWAIVDAGAGFVTVDDLDVCGPIWDRVHGVWVHEPDPSTAAHQARAARAAIAERGLPMRPIIAVLTPGYLLQDPLKLVGLAEYDWLAPEVYEESTTDDWWSAKGRMARHVQRILASTNMPIMLVAQAYDRRTTADRPAGFSEDALEAYQPAYFDAWRENPSRIKGVIGFAYARPGGALERPNIVRWYRAALNAADGRPAVEQPRQGGGTTVQPKVTIEGAWPVKVEVDAGGRARVRAVAKITQGVVDRLEWRIRPVGGGWTIVARNPSGDLDHHFEVGIGEYQIGLDAVGPYGRDSTGSDRRIVVTQKSTPAPDPGPDPEPQPVPGDVVVRFLAPNGKHYLTALNGGGHPGEDFRGQPAGLITAHVHARDVGGWQDFTVRGGKRRGTFGFRSVNGGWVTLQADNRLVANVHRPADYLPEGRQAFILVDLGGGQVGIQGANTKFLAAINAGGADVVMDRDTAKDWERWVPSPSITIPDLEPESTRVDRPIVGLVRPFGPRGIRDDVGPFLATALSRFYLMQAQATDVGRVARELDQDAAYGYHPRVLAEVRSLDGSGFWDTTGWDGDDPRTEAVIAAICQGARDRGIRIAWTAMGKSPATRSRDARLAQVRRVGRVLRDYPDAVLIADVMNEPAAGWDGPEPGELFDLADALDEASGRQFIVGTGAVWTDRGWVDGFDGGATAFSPAGWAKTQRRASHDYRSIAIAHLDRDQARSEERDRPWRQGWDVGLEGDRWADLEHVGDGSSVTAESRPAVLRSHRLVAHICRAAVSCLHGAAGVRGLEPWDGRTAYHEVWKSRRYLDPDLVNGQQQNANPKYPGRPFTVDGEFIRADTQNRRGIVRCYSVQAPNGVTYTVPFGPVDYTYPDRGTGAGTVRLRAERDLHVQALQQDLGTEVWTKDVRAGESIEVDSRYPDLLLICR